MAPASATSDGLERQPGPADDSGDTDPIEVGSPGTLAGGGRGCEPPTMPTIAQGSDFDSEAFEDHLTRAIGVDARDTAGREALDFMASYTQALTVNGPLRAGQRLTGRAKEIDETLHRLSGEIRTNGVVYRAVDNLEKVFHLKRGELPVRGDWGRDSGWMSTSSADRAAERHLREMLDSDVWPGRPPQAPALLHISTPSRQRGVWTAGRKRFAWQKELMLAPGTRLEVRDVILRGDQPPVIVCVVR